MWQWIEWWIEFDDGIDRAGSEELLGKGFFVIENYVASFPEISNVYQFSFKLDK